MGLAPARLTAAVSPDSSAASLAVLLFHPLPWVASAAAGNTSTPRWARNLAIRTRHRYAHPLVRWHDDVDAHHLQHVARNRKTSVEAVIAVVTHPNADESVWRAVASRKYLSHGEIVALLERDNLPGDLLATLTDRITTDSDHYTHPDGGSQQRRSDMLLRVAKHPNASPEVLTAVAESADDSDVVVLRAVAEHHRCPESVAVAAALRCR